MSPTPGTEVIQVDSAPPRPSPSDTGQALFVGEAERGPIGAVLHRSLAEFVAVRGARQSYSYLYDAVEAFFREGGERCWTARVIADTAVSAFVDLNDATPAATLRVSAAGPGVYGNDLAVVVLTHAEDDDIPSGSFRLQILDGGDVLEETPSFVDKQAALDWSASSPRTVVLSDRPATGDPVAVADPGSALATGADNRGAITETEWTEALARLNKDLGPGQVAMPGRTTDAAHTNLLAHAKERNRHALIDLPDTATQATVRASARSADAGVSARYGSAYWPWAVVPGLTDGTLRVVPWSAVQAGLCARSDAEGNPNQPVAGERRGRARWAIGLSQDVRAVTEDERGSLNDAGVNVVILPFVGGRPQTYGNRTLRLTTVDALWAQASGSRLAMWIAAQGDEVLRRYVFEEIDGKGRLQAALAGELAGLLGILYEQGALYGATAEDAYAVDTGPSINTPERIAAGELRAAVSFRASPGAERVTLELVRRSILEAVV